MAQIKRYNMRRMATSPSFMLGQSVFTIFGDFLSSFFSKYFRKARSNTP